MIRRMMMASLMRVNPSEQNWRMGLNMSITSVTGDAITNWNNLKSGVAANTAYNNLIDTTGANKGVSMTIRSANVNEAAWYDSGSELSDYPDRKIYRAGWWGGSASNINVDNLRFSGLNNSKFYSFRIVTSDISQDNISLFRIGEESVTKISSEVVDTDSWDDPAYAAFNYISPINGNIDLYLDSIVNGSLDNYNILAILIAEYNYPVPEWKLEKKELGTTESPLGYYTYSPINTGAKTYPLLIMLHGDGERGNGTTELDRVLIHGPLKYVEAGTWAPLKPMIISAPQSATNGYNISNVRAHIEYMMANYPVDPERVYLTGLSMGGGDVLNYLGVYNTDPIVKAIVPMSCYNWEISPTIASMVSANIPIWTFTNNGDPSTEFSDVETMVEEFNTIKQNSIILTVFNANDHTSVWDKVYSGSGIGQQDPAYAPFNQDIYSWMLQYT